MADYVTVPEFLKRFDPRDVGDLASDNAKQVTEVELVAGNENLAVCILDASGDIDSALLAGGKYTTDELEGLAGNALAKLRRMCSEITMSYLLDRRPDFSPERMELYDKVRSRHLEKLRRGENVFNLADHVTAGAVSVDGPTTQKYDDLNLMRDRVRNYYPERRLPNNR